MYLYLAEELQADHNLVLSTHVPRQREKRRGKGGGGIVSKDDENKM
jgi:hypothetical protein